MTYPALVWFRSPQPDRSWVVAAGTVLDAASPWLAAVDHPPDPRAGLCIRAGYVALRRIADFFGIAHERHPGPHDPISIARTEFDEVVDRMAEAGIPIRRDRERAWRDFAGWRVNYDTVLLRLAELTLAPTRRGRRTVPPSTTLRHGSPGGGRAVAGRFTPPRSRAEPRPVGGIVRRRRDRHPGRRGSPDNGRLREAGRSGIPGGP